MTTRILIGVILGGALGFGWHKWVGCTSGACVLAANPWLSTVYGMAMGALAAGNFR